MSRLKSWLQASRLPSQLYICFPLLLGEMIAYGQTRRLDLGLFLLAHLFGIAIQLYIVYANDYADYALDALNTTYTIFSGGSRVLLDGQISRRTLGQAAGWMAGCAIAAALFMILFFGRMLAVVFALFSIFLLYAYSYPPFKLSYRGGGELLQMLGVGAVLPLFGYYAQAGNIAHFPFAVLLLLLPTNLACAIATSLPDEPSDRQGSKRTLTVLCGNYRAKLFVVFLNALTYVQLGPLLFFREENRFVCEFFIFTTLLFLSLSLLSFPRALPGTRRIEVFVSCSIAVTILTTLALARLFATTALF